MTQSTSSERPALAGSATIHTGLRGEQLRATTWAEWSGENADLFGPEAGFQGEAIERELLAGKPYQGGGGAQPVWVVAPASAVLRSQPVALRPTPSARLKVPAGLQVVFFPRLRTPDGRKAMAGYGEAWVLEGQGFEGPSELWISGALLRSQREHASYEALARWQARNAERAAGQTGGVR